MNRDDMDFGGLSRDLDLDRKRHASTYAGFPLKYRPRPTTERIILHDSHTYAGLENGAEYLLVNGRSRGLLSIGYNFVIERSGETTECRPFDRVGSHTPGHNHRSIGVCLIGGLGDGKGMAAMGEAEDNFTMNQMQALRRLVRSIRRLYPEVPLVGHSELQRFHGGARCPCLAMQEVRLSVNRGEGVHLDL